MQINRSPRSKTPTKYVDSAFTILPIVWNIVIIVALLGIYYYAILVKGLFPTINEYIFWVIKAIVALNIIIASARSVFAPILVIGLGGLGYYVKSILDMTLFSTTDYAQLVGMGVVGLLILLWVRLLKP